MKTIIAALLLSCPGVFGEAPPKSWIDTDTGHRVVRLTDEPGSASLYFNQNGYTPDGKDLVYTTPNGISVLDLERRVSRQIVKGRATVIVAGFKNRTIYYTQAGAVYRADIDNGSAREIAKVPARGSIVAVNSDETLLAGTYTEGNESRLQTQPQVHALDQPPDKEQMMENRLAARIPMGMFTINVKTGETKTILKTTDWLGHVQFSPADPTLLLYCHEGPWHKVDRIWTIRTDGSHIAKIHARTMAMEIFGHEFWSADGKTIWYDLQTPRGEVFWLAAFNVDTGARTWYSLQRNEWSIHFNVSRDGSLICGDGGDEGQVARATDGRWIYLYRPEMLPSRGIEDKNFVKPGVLRAERLVNMSKHQYRLEPNVTFTPDQKWVVFRSNMFGETYVFAVEVARAR